MITWLSCGAFTLLGTILDRLPTELCLTPQRCVPTHLCHGLEVIGVPQLYCLVESAGGEQPMLRDVRDSSHTLAVTVHDRKP